MDLLESLLIVHKTTHTALKSISRMMVASTVRVMMMKEAIAKDNIGRILMTIIDILYTTNTLKLL